MSKQQTLYNNHEKSKDRQLLLWPVLLWAQYIVDHWLLKYLIFITYYSEAVSQGYSLITKIVKKIIGLMIVWVYSKFDLIFLTQISPLVFHENSQSLKKNVHEYHLGPSFCFIKYRKLCFKK